MPEVGVDWTQIEEHPKDAVRFFRIMMRFEFALKECRYTQRIRRRDGSFKIDWDRYAREKLGPGFVQELRDKQNLKVLLDRPPSRQVLEPDSSLAWRDANPILDSQLLLGAVCRVRNNLFHGGKSGDPDEDRGDDLVMDSITVITAILLRDQELHQVFSGRY